MSNRIRSVALCSGVSGGQAATVARISARCSGKVFDPLAEMDRVPRRAHVRS